MSPININTKKKQVKAPIIPINASQRTVHDMELDSIRQKSFVRKNTFKQDLSNTLQANNMAVAATKEEETNTEPLQENQITIDEIRRKYESEEQGTN